VVEEVKKQSSKWMKGIDPSLSKFTWQIGYGAFSVSGGKVETVKNYIGKQKEHHTKRTYMEEVEEFIREYGVIEYEAKYFWG